jgi:uncharacterized membrane protein HdeD (DUF308 family)
MRLEFEVDRMSFSIDGRVGKTAILAGILSFVVGVLNFNIFAPHIFGICVYVGTFLVISGFLGVMDIFSARRKSVAALSAVLLFTAGACFASALVLPILDIRVQMTYAFWCLGFHPGQFLYAFPLSPFFFPLMAMGVTLCVAGIVIPMLFR